MARNPAWTRDELILALDLYFHINPARVTAAHPDIIALSELLNQLPIHDIDFKDVSFRNPNGVYMKLCNFLRLDPDYPGKGLDAGSKLDIEIWDEFSGKHDLLEITADTIRRNIHQVQEKGGFLSPVIIEDEEFFEGKLLTRIHLTKERNQTLIKRKKDSVLKQSGALSCEVCGFDFRAFYGELGAGFAECHHKTPVSELNYDQPTKLSDLAIVCANCHRMIHRARPMLTVSELREIVFSLKTSFK